MASSLQESLSIGHAVVHEPQVLEAGLVSLQVEGLRGGLLRDCQVQPAVSTEPDCPGHIRSQIAFCSKFPNPQLCHQAQKSQAICHLLPALGAATQGFCLQHCSLVPFLPWSDPLTMSHLLQTLVTQSYTQPPAPLPSYPYVTGNLCLRDVSSQMCHASQPLSSPYPTPGSTGTEP